ncbi:hypothetical protein, partial [Pseudophaeobacter profundi]|uniref:hypothetical protein n=1 Tax=Pseudophaeobacter profundi TaxID=3034152 RepID=UPI00242D2555
MDVSSLDISKNLEHKKVQNKQVPEIRKEEIKENTFVRVQHGKKQEDNKKHKLTSLQDNQNKGINNTAYLT